MNVDILGIRELKWTGMGEFYYMLGHLLDKSIRNTDLFIIFTSHIIEI